MENSKLFCKQFSYRALFYKIYGFTALFLIFVLVSLLSCVEKKMTLKEAKEVTISIEGKLYEPPPRRMNEIISILEQPGKFDPELAKKARLKVDAKPPERVSASKLAEFYYERGLAASYYGRNNQSWEDFRTAAKYAKSAKNIDKSLHARIISKLASWELWYGNYKQSIIYQKESLRILENPMAYSALASQYFRIGDLEAGKEVAKKGIEYCDRLISRQQAGQWIEYWREIISASVSEAQGQYVEAEPRHRARIKIEYDRRDSYPGLYLRGTNRLIQNLRKQGRSLEAEIEARRALSAAIGLDGKQSNNVMLLCLALTNIKIEQQRLSEAEKLINTLIQSMEKSDIPYSPYRMGEAYLLKAKILVEKLSFDEAMEHYDRAKTFFPKNKYIFVRDFNRNPYYMISLIKTNRTKEAVSKISSAYEVDKNFLGENHYRTASMLGLRGMAYIRMNRKEQALKDFSTAIPILIKKSDSKDTIITRLIIEEYIGFLADITAKPIEQKFEIDAIVEAFRLTGAIHKSSVQKALGASGARAAIRDPELAELVRQEQDTVQKIQAYEATIINALASPPDQQNHEAINNLKAKVMSLRGARVVLLNEIKNRFPKYSDFTNPKLSEIIAVQQLLHEQEALILIYTGIERTYVWAIPQKGKVHFDAVSLGNSELQIIVQHLRKALDPAALTFGDIPSFDLNQAHRLFAELLNPVNEGWKNAKDLIIVTPGPLGNLPFSILPAAPVKLSKDTDELFANYREVPWLIRKVSISRQPSVSAFVTQRKLPKGDVSRKSFVGFGDPLFNKEQLAQAETEELKQKISLSNPEKALHLRGIRITELGNLDSDEITTIHIDSLKRLPDTSKEIKSIATALGADPNQDIFLGKRASERQVKTMDLSDRSIIAFATHALISGDLDGLYQPALALSAPAVTGDDGDGLLTLDEILQLNLNARWVVLSACNTGAAQGAGEESVSGLGRAFFYAGTKAILVSMWPVETTSARKLTTALFQYQMENNKLSRARALRKSMLSLIDGPGFIDNASGKIVASYAHPLFWAPFIIVGEGGYLP